MADLDYTDYRESSDVPLGASVAAFMNWAGAAVSLALIAGLAFWGYQLLVRDVTGVPVVRALEGPMRIAPEDPGGQTAAYQGLAVNEIAAVGTAAAPADLVVLAPAETNLTEEDMPMSALLPDAPEAPIAEVAAQPVSATDLAVAAALAESPLVTLASASAEDIPEAAPAALVVEATEEGVVATSPRPAPRPERRLASLDPAPVVTQSNEIDVAPASIQPGERLVQLGAYPTEDLAREEWDRMAGRFSDFMEGKGRVIQEAEAGGRTFYRLRVHGFEDLSDSRRFCAVLIAGEASCIPVAWR